MTLPLLETLPHTIEVLQHNCNGYRNGFSNANTKQLRPRAKFSQPQHPLQCTMATVTTETIGSYFALSYVWGSDERSHSLTCNEQTIQITFNLWEALRGIRSNSEAMALWIDAICINQNDTAEKTDQLKLMSFIYKGAQQVLIWLGPDHDGSIQKAFQAAEPLGRRNIRDKFSAHLFPNSYRYTRTKCPHTVSISAVGPNQLGGI